MTESVKVAIFMYHSIIVDNKITESNVLSNKR